MHSSQLSCSVRASISSIVNSCVAERCDSSLQTASVPGGFLTLLKSKGTDSAGAPTNVYTVSGLLVARACLV